MFAAIRGHAEVVRLLSEAGADKDAATDEGYVPLRIFLNCLYKTQEDNQHIMFIKGGV